VTIKKGEKRKGRGIVGVWEERGTRKGRFRGLGRGGLGSIYFSFI